MPLLSQRLEGLTVQAVVLQVLMSLLCNRHVFVFAVASRTTVVRISVAVWSGESGVMQASHMITAVKGMLLMHS